MGPVASVSATKNTCSYGAPGKVMPESSRTALCPPSQPATYAACDGGHSAVRERCGYVTGFLVDAGELGVPLHRKAPVAEMVAHDPLVVVLAQHQDKGKRTDALPDVTQRDARRPLSFRPHIGAVAAAAHLERTLRDPELGVDLERARMHRHRPRLLCRPGMPVHDQRVDPAAPELIGEHQSGGAASHDQYVRIHVGRGPVDYI